MGQIGRVKSVEVFTVQASDTHDGPGDLKIRQTGGYEQLKVDRVPVRTD